MTGLGAAWVTVKEKRKKFREHILVRSTKFSDGSEPEVSNAPKANHIYTRNLIKDINILYSPL